MKHFHSIRKWTSCFLAALLLISLFAGSIPATVFGSGSVLTYRFTDAGFDGRPTQEGWRILGALPGVPNTRWQSYGAQIQSTTLNQSREFEFKVPATGYYTLQLSGFMATAGGLAAVLVDNVKVGEYMFYSPVNGYGPKNTLKTVYLTEGMHLLKVQVIQKGASSFAMYPSEFTLIERSGPALVESVSVQVEAGTNELVLDQATRLLLDVKLDDGTVPAPNEIEVSYASSDPSVASVSNGTITALRAGTSDITVTVTKDGANKQAVVPIRVLNARLDSVSIQLDRNPLVAGQTMTAIVNGLLDDGTPTHLIGAVKTFASDNAAIASVSASGVIKAVSPGTTTIRVSASLGSVTKTASIELTVIAKVLESVTLTAEPSVLMLGMHGKLNVKGTMNDGTAADLTSAAFVFQSGNESVITISDRGELRTHAMGTSVLTAEVTLGSVTKAAELAVEVVPVQSDKTRSTYYTSEEVSAARENIGLYSWAAAQRDSSVASADKFVAKGLEFLWSSVPGQSLPRSYQTNQNLGNLSPLYNVAPSENPLNKLGNYPWQANPLNEPWKLTDPTSGYKFPTNDFGGFYRSGLDEHGVFDPSKADRSLLVNTLYPEKGPTWGVDDGTGWIDPQTGYRYTFIAYYVHWHLWYGGNSVIQTGLSALTNAYLFTGDPKYARAGSVLLDRVADMYPSMDISKYSSAIYLNSHGGTGIGKVVGSIWETGLVKTFISAYDAFFPGMDDPAIVQFLSAKGEQYDLPLKNSTAGIRRNIEDGILRQTFEGFKTAKIRGNNGYHQSSLAMAAVVLDKNPETKEWLDYTFQTGEFLRNPDRITGGNILNTLVNDVDRDGNGNEAAPGYNASWLSTYLQVADMLEGYDLYPAADLYQNVKIQKMFHGIYPMTMIERYTAQIGDSGSTGNVGTLLDKAQAIKAFSKYGDPIFAQIAYFMNNNNVSGIHSDIFTRNPDQIAQQIEQAIALHGPFKLDSANLTGYGFAALRDGEKSTFVYNTAYSFPQLPVVENTKEYKYFESSGAQQFEATQVGDRIAYSFDVAEADHYEISLKPFKAGTYGIYSIQIDGSPVATLDFFGSGAEHVTIGSMDLLAGTHTITFEAIGKNSLSSGYKMALIELALLDELEKARRDSSDTGNTLRDVWMYYGRNGGHGHRDTLNLGMHAYGLDLMPELGYPEQANATDAHRHEWVNNVISHNTVLVDKHKPAVQIVAQPKHYDDSEQVKLIDVEAPKLYAQTDLYKRTTAMIRVDNANSYAVDFFRVIGGKEHHFSFHGAEGTVTTNGLSLTPQASGTYAGENVQFGVRPANDSAPGSGYTGPGFHWLKNVERDNNPSEMFSVDYDIADLRRTNDDDIHLRLTMLGSIDDVALADGVPPRNKPGNPESLRFVVAHRSGENLSSLFTSVIEPYVAERYIRSIAAVPVKLGGTLVDENSLSVRAVKVELVNGRTDYIVSALDPTLTYTIDDKLSFRGSFGVYSELEGQQVYGYVNDGTEIGKIEGTKVQASIGSLNGTIVDFTKELSSQNSITVQLALQGINPSQLIGRFLYADNDGTRNAAYQIKGVQSLGEGRLKLDIGDITLVRSFKDANDFGKGYIYDVSEGAAFRIPLSVEEHIPLTKAAITGVKEGEWYTSEATVTLTVYGKSANVSRTEYRLDGGAWSAYGSPIVLKDSGTYALEYRSLNLSGIAEETKKHIIRIDRLPPVTEANVQGEVGRNGWYVSNASVSLQANDPHSGVALTEYSISLVQAPARVAQTVTGSTYGPSPEVPIPSPVTNGFVPYSGAILFGEGVYELSFRSKDAVGHSEAARTMTIKIDKTDPAYTLRLNGNDVSGEMTIHDAQLAAFTVVAEDAMSGVASVVMTVDGMPYSAGTALDWAGKLGPHQIAVTITDAAGNAVTSAYTVTVAVTIESLLQLVSRYESEGGISGPLVSQIRNDLDQAKHQAEAGHPVQAIKHLEDVLKHLNNEPLQEHVSGAAKAALQIDVEAVIQGWSQ